jgi:hypothetical protein
MLNGLFRRMLGRSTPVVPTLVPQSDEWASLDLDPELSAPKAAKLAPQLSDVALEIVPAAARADTAVAPEKSLQSFALMDMDAADDEQAGGAGVTIDIAAPAALPDVTAAAAAAESPAEVKPARKARRCATAADAAKPRRRSAVDFRAAWALPGPDRESLHNDAVELVSLEGLSALTTH